MRPVSFAPICPVQINKTVKSIGIALEMQVQVLLSAGSENRLFLGKKPDFKRFFDALNGNENMRVSTIFCP